MMNSYMESINNRTKFMKLMNDIGTEIYKLSLRFDMFISRVALFSLTHGDAFDSFITQHRDDFENILSDFKRYNEALDTKDNRDDDKESNNDDSSDTNSDVINIARYMYDMAEESSDSIMKALAKKMLEKLGEE